MNQFSPSPAEAVAVPCPRCQKPLIDPAGLGWCKACGFCRSLAESDVKIAEEPAPTQPSAVAVTGSAILHTPTWFWVVLIGTILVSGGTYAASTKLTFNPLHRALLTTVEMIIGIIVMFAGQFIGLLKTAPDEPTLSFKDAIFPFRLYGLILKHLPSTRHSLYLGAWGAAAVISAAVFVGGLDHWFTYLPGYKPPSHKNTKK